MPGRLGVCFVAALLLLCACTEGSDSATEVSTSSVLATLPATTTVPPVEMSLANEELLERQLASQSLEEFTSAFSPAVAAAILALPRPMSQAGLPLGSTIDIDSTTFEAKSPDIAVVNATVVSVESQPWLLFLQKVGDQWLVYGTEKVRT